MLEKFFFDFKSIYKFFMILFFSAILFNPVLINFGFNYVYLFLGIFILFLSLLKGFDGESLFRMKSLILYIFLLLCSLIFTVFNSSGNNPLISFGIYVMPIVFWMIFMNAHDDFSYAIFFRDIYLILVFVAFLGIIQYFLSPTLFDLIPIESRAIEWASRTTFEQYALFFRASSTLGSPQVFGMFCSLCLILSLRFSKNINIYIFYLGILLFFVGGILSGNKAFFLSIAIYFSALIFQRRTLSRLTIALLLFLIFYFSGLLQIITDSIPILERVFSIAEILEQESEDSRISKYLYILQNTNPFFGNGLGSITNQSFLDLTAAESYYLKIYFEAGAFVFLALLIVCLNFFFSAMFNKFSDVIICLIFFLNMMIVHAFESPVAIIFWGYLIYQIYLHQRKIYLEKNVKKSFN